MVSAPILNTVIINKIKKITQKLAQPKYNHTLIYVDAEEMVDKQEFAILCARLGWDLSAHQIITAFRKYSENDEQFQLGQLKREIEKHVK